MVALRKESVDRNLCFVALKAPAKRSLSARRAWIEIQKFGFCDLEPIVALRKESVDRNSVGRGLTGDVIGRSPQGERG